MLKLKLMMVTMMIMMMVIVMKVKMMTTTTTMMMMMTTRMRMIMMMRRRRATTTMTISPLATPLPLLPCNMNLSLALNGTANLHQPEYQSPSFTGSPSPFPRPDFLFPHLRRSHGCFKCQKPQKKMDSLLCDKPMKTGHSNLHSLAQIHLRKATIWTVAVRVGLAHVLAHSPEGHMWVITPQIYGHITPQKSILRPKDGQGLPNRKIVSIV